MRRTHACILALGLVATFTASVGWTLWSPDLTVKYHENVDAMSRLAADSYIREHPPKKSPLTWELLLKKAANPYKREKESIFVANVDNTDGSKILFIRCPHSDEDISLTVENDGSWHRAEPSSGIPMIGRLFQHKKPNKP